jgi:hypothetical protein
VRLWIAPGLACIYIDAYPVDTDVFQRHLRVVKKSISLFFIYTCTVSVMSSYFCIENSLNQKVRFVNNTAL